MLPAPHGKKEGRRKSRLVGKQVADFKISKI